MNNRFFLAVLAASVIAFFGGWIIFGVVFSDYYMSNTKEVAKILVKPEPEIWAIAIGNIAWSILITYVLQKTGNTSFAKGFITSLWFSFLVMLIFDLSVYAFWDIYGIKFVITDILISSVFWGIVGSVSGAILGIKKKTVATA
jgi:hypothetical protein